MTLPLPTDSLYKFIALAGLGTALYFSLYDRQLQTEWRVASSTWEKSKMTLSIQEKKWRAIYPRVSAVMMAPEDAAELETLTAELQVRDLQDLRGIQEQNRTLSILSRINALLSKDVTSRVNQVIDELVENGEVTLSFPPDGTPRKDVEAYYSLVESYGHNLKELDLLVERGGEIRRERSLCRWGIIVGVLLVASGFALWYWKVQRFQDAAVANKSSSI